jgi:hypothetical protein
MTSEREKLKDALGDFPFTRGAPLGQLVTPECSRCLISKIVK